MASRDDLIYCGIRWAVLSDSALFVWVTSEGSSGVWHIFFLRLYLNPSDISLSEVACCVESGQPSQLTGRPSWAHTMRTVRTLSFNGCWCRTSKDRFIDRLVLCYLEEERHWWTSLTLQETDVMQKRFWTLFICECIFFKDTDYYFQFCTYKLDADILPLHLH